VTRKAFRHALVVGKFAPFHAGHQLLVDTALRESDRLTLMVYSNPDFPNMTQAVRASWIKEIYPQVDVHLPLDPPPDLSSDFIHREFVANYLREQELEIDVVFTSEAYGDGFAAHLGVAHRQVDIERIRAPISGTAIRSGPQCHLRFLHPVVRRHFQ